MISFASLLLPVVVIVSWLPPHRAPSVPNTPFDQYGAISWEDEKARLDNFAIHLQNDEKLIGYVLVFDAVGGCPGEAQARRFARRNMLSSIEVLRGTELSGGVKAILKV
jgi:hypothetical protein